jgi:hypothetical protein
MVSKFIVMASLTMKTSYFSSGVARGIRRLLQRQLRVSRFPSKFFILFLLSCRGVLASVRNAEKRSSRRNIPDLFNVQLLPELVKDINRGAHVDKGVKSFLVNCHPYVSALAQQ